MAKLLLRIFTLFGFLFILSNVYSEGILIFEISDAQNKPVSGLTIDVKKDGKLHRSYTTNESGRLVDAFIPEGTYTYSFDFGDLNSGTFVVKDGDYTWINLDYRLWTITFKDDEDTPLANKKATIYKVNEDNTETLVSEKMSDVAGITEFLVPEGKYKYSTFRGSNYQEVKDQNINTAIGVTSGEITHQTHFCFINDKKENLTIFAKDISVTHIAPDSVYIFGSVDAHSKTISHGYYLYNTTESYVSCPAGTYTCTVETQDYGNISDTFIVDDNDPLIDNIVYLVLPTLPDTSKGDDDEKKKELYKLEAADTISPQTPIKLKVYAILEDDHTTPIANALSSLLKSSDYEIRSPYAFTNDSGFVIWYVAPDTFDIAILNDTLKKVGIDKDSTIYMYINSSDFTKIYFDFYLGTEKFNPTSVDQILVWPSDEEEAIFTIYGEKGEDYAYDDPILLPYNTYSYSFYLEEKDYHRRFIKDFTVRRGDTLIRNKTTLEPFYTLNIEMRDINGLNFESRQYIEINQYGFTSRLVTDSLGFYTGRHIIGDYTLSALGDTQSFTLNADTTIYFQSKALNSQKVKFQFLHDGNLVYPQIMNMDIYTNEETPYSKAISHFYEEYEGNTNVWVFDEPTICEVNKYYIEYVLKDYDYNGTFKLNFEIVPSLSPDTLIYIVVPVKRSVTITIKDANLDLVNGVFGNIYKYDENGVLQESTDYDDGSHAGLRTNSAGNIIDHLVPGRYQIRILDIARDFIVKDYDLSFDIISGTKLYDVKYIVLYETSKKPATDLLLDVNKDNNFYNATYTDQDGKVELFCETGDYTYHLHYDNGYDGNYTLKKDTTIYLYVKDPIHIDSMEILGCACLSHNDSIPLNITILPEDATLKEIDWSVDNDILAHITSEGVLITHNVNTDGFITITASSKDGSGVTATRKFFVGDGNCGPNQFLRYDNTSETEIPLTTDSVKVIIYTTDKDEFTHVYLFQTSSDSIHWTNAYGPTSETEFVMPAQNIKKDMLFRALVANSEKDILKFAEDNDADCGSNKITNTLSIRLNHLVPSNWPDSICSTQEEVTFTIDENQIGTIANGYQLVWSKKLGGESDYTRLEYDGEKSITIPAQPGMTIKAAIQKGDSAISSFEQTLFIEEKPVFHLTTSQDTVCRGDEVKLTVVVTEGAISNPIWSDGTKDTTTTVNATTDLYTIKAESYYGLCESQTDTIRLVLDEPIDFELKLDKEVICSTDTNGIIISIDSTNHILGDIVWDDNSTADTLHITPKESGSNKATVQSLYNKCLSVTKYIPYEVRQPLSVAISTDQFDICQYGNDSITLTAEVTSGEAKLYNWWDGTQSKENHHTFVPQKNMSPWVYISDNVCADSDKDSLDIQVAKPATIQLSSSNKVFEYGVDIHLIADTSSFIYGPYSWYSIDADGDEQLITVSDEIELDNMPNGDVTYHIVAENGACPKIESNSIKATLVDNIVIPTVFTPYTVDGENDDFMPGYPVIIYDRYGDIVCNSSNGWDGYYKGKLSDPGVYIYVLTLKDGRVVKGTIEIFRK